jgi:hypothetical protein
LWYNAIFFTVLQPSNYLAQSPLLN